MPQQGWGPWAPSTPRLRLTAAPASQERGMVAFWRKRGRAAVHPILDRGAGAWGRSPQECWGFCPPASGNKDDTLS